MINDERKNRTGTAGNPPFIIHHSAFIIDNKRPVSSHGHDPLRGCPRLTGLASPGRLGLRARGDDRFIVPQAGKRGEGRGQG